MIDHPVALVKYAALVGCGVTHSVALVGCDVSRIPPEILNVYFYISVMMAYRVPVVPAFGYQQRV